MRREAAAIVALMAITACSSKAAQLKEQMERMRRAGATPAELCSKAREIEKAALERGSEAEYREAKSDVTVQCGIANLTAFATKR